MPVDFVIACALLALPVLVLVAELASTVYTLCALLLLLLTTSCLRRLTTSAARERRLDGATTYAKYIAILDAEAPRSGAGANVDDSASRAWLARSREGGSRALMVTLHGLLGPAPRSHTLSPALVQDVCDALASVGNDATLTPHERLAFFQALRLAHGRTALALSGGGALALSHFGVVAALCEHGLLPRVISGCSGGSIVAATLAITEDRVVADVTASAASWISTSTLQARLGLEDPRVLPPYFPPFLQMLSHFTREWVRGEANPSLIASEGFQRSMRAHFGQHTFRSAHALTGRVVSISIVAHTGGASSVPVLLNFVTSPDVLLWSAVCASCALPGLMRAAPLYCINEAGDMTSYSPPGVTHSASGGIRRAGRSKELK